MTKLSKVCELMVSSFAGSQQSAPLFVMEKANTSIVGKTAQTLHKIKHPWLILVLLSELYDHIKVEKSVEFMRVVKLFLKKVFEYQLLDVTNNFTLQQEVNYFVNYR